MSASNFLGSSPFAPSSSFNALPGWVEPDLVFASLLFLLHSAVSPVDALLALASSAFTAAGFLRAVE
jgi:hypothetical protein